MSRLDFTVMGLIGCLHKLSLCINLVLVPVGFQRPRVSQRRNPYSTKHLVSLLSSIALLRSSSVSHSLTKFCSVLQSFTPVSHVTLKSYLPFTRLELIQKYSVDLSTRVPLGSASHHFCELMSERGYGSKSLEDPYFRIRVLV